MRILQGMRIYPNMLYGQITGLHERDWDKNSVKLIQKRLQSFALTKIKAAVLPNAAYRIRKKLDRWHNIPYGVQGLPGHYGPIIARRMKALSKVVPPRVSAAVFRGIWNGWVTHRRFQKRSASSNTCVFLCGGAAEDSIEHYCRCPVVMDVARNIFRMSYPESFALNVWVLNAAWLEELGNLTSAALLIYGVYMAQNNCRHKPLHNSRQVYDHIVQHCKQGTAGHGGCMKHLDSLRAKPINHYV